MQVESKVIAGKLFASFNIVGGDLLQVVWLV